MSYITVTGQGLRRISQASQCLISAITA